MNEEQRELYKELCESQGKRVGRYALMKAWDITESEARAFLNWIGISERVKANKREATIVIGDTHAPFMHPRYIEFLKDVESQWNCTKVIHAGDLVDLHALSRHNSETMADGAKLEHEKAMIQVKELTEAFPKLTLLLGNHDRIVERNVSENGIPASIYMKKFEDVYNLPKEWNVTESIIIDNVLYEHGIGSAGKYGAVNSAEKERMSYVQGHAHSGGGVMYQANARDIIFGLNVGCGIDTTAYAFAYGKPFKRKPTIGCGVVVSDSEAYFIPMDLDNKYRKLDHATESK